jgi:hypothetical protein
MLESPAWLSHPILPTCATAADGRYVIYVPSHTADGLLQGGNRTDVASEKEGPKQQG